VSLHADRLPAFPWDALTPLAELARSHPDGLVDLSVGTPVDPTPGPIAAALAAAADSPGYPATAGSPQLRAAIVRWFGRRRAVSGLTEEQVLPTIGSKELVGLLPSLLGLGAGDVVLHPVAAYPTYDVGARLAGATPEPCDRVVDRLDRADNVRLVWLNSPANPDGSVLSVAELSSIVAAARRASDRHGREVVIASDECYAELAWEAPWIEEGVPSLLDPRVTGGSSAGLLVAYSLSKQSNLAGYRAAFVAGDPGIVDRLLQVRRHAGLMVPGPVQAAMVVALDDDAQVAAQRERYRQRRLRLRAAFEQAGYLVDGSVAGLYLWVRPEGEQDCWATVADLAQLGILVTPGAFYGDRRHVRVALTATDESVAHAVGRLTGA
jgi:succinyldiaminopimelate transaminase